MSDQSDAVKIINFIKGTAIADLRSQADWVWGFLDQKVPLPTDGKQNFALALLSLVTCETCGYYMTGASKAPVDLFEETADVGTYIIQFMDKYFLRGSVFKDLSKVLADFLRHVLVHSYGAYDSPRSPFGLGLYINLDRNEIARAVVRDGKAGIELNSLALAEQTLDAFEKFKKAVEKGDSAELLAKIIRARDHEIEIGKPIVNQFNVMYERLKQKQS
jgi:hypothetical protein